MYWWGVRWKRVSNLILRSSANVVRVFFFLSWRKPTNIFYAECLRQWMTATNDNESNNKKLVQSNKFGSHRICKRHNSIRWISMWSKTMIVRYWCHINTADLIYMIRKRRRKNEEKENRRRKKRRRRWSGKNGSSLTRTNISITLWLSIYFNWYLFLASLINLLNSIVKLPTDSISVGRLHSFSFCSLSLSLRCYSLPLFRIFIEMSNFSAGNNFMGTMSWKRTNLHFNLICRVRHSAEFLRVQWPRTVTGIQSILKCQPAINDPCRSKRIRKNQLARENKNTLTRKSQNDEFNLQIPSKTLNIS